MEIFPTGSFTKTTLLHMVVLTIGIKIVILQETKIQLLVGQEWQTQQTMLINEKQLNLMNPETRGYLQQEMEASVLGEVNSSVFAKTFR